MADLYAVTAGLHVGKLPAPSAFCLITQTHRAAIPEFADPHGDNHARALYEAALAMRERGELPAAGGVETVFDVRAFSRLEAGATYPAQARAVAQALRAAASRTPIVPRLYVHITGVGGAFLGLLREYQPPCVIVPVYINDDERLRWQREGEPPAMSNRLHRRDFRPWQLLLGREWLVTRLQALFQSQRIRVSEKNKDAKMIHDELLNYDAERDGNHDLVTALGLATLTEQAPAAERIERRGTALLPGVL